MMYVRLSNTGLIAETIDHNPQGIHHPSLNFMPFTSLEDKQAAWLHALPLCRLSVETGGVMIDGTTILTDRGSQTQLANAYQSLVQPFVDAVDWKSPTGWITVTEPELRPIARLVARHVQGCFSAERLVEQHIRGAGDLDDFDMHGMFDATLSGLLEAA